MPNSAISFNSSGMPAGLVFPYAGNAVPSGFLECDGSEVDKTAYPNLYAAIQDTYATQTNPLTGAAWAAPASGKFRLPDYRGSFLRGVGTFTDGIGTDTSLGGYQGDAMQGHSHTNSSSGSQYFGTGFGTGGNRTVPSAIASQDGFLVTLQGPSNDGTNGNPRSGKETRVRNKGVKYIIKV